MDSILGKGSVEQSGRSTVMERPSSASRKFTGGDEEGDDRSGLTRDTQKAMRCKTTTLCIDDFMYRRLYDKTASAFSSFCHVFTFVAGLVFRTF